MHRRPTEGCGIGSIGRRWLAAVAVAAIVCGLGACETSEDRLALAEVHHTPLAFDPTEEHELEIWWSNGHQMLQLEKSGGYALYGSTNRYRAPAEQGSWSRERYFELHLSPYDVLRRERVRVGITKEHGELVLHLPRLDPMLAITRPPRVPEDDLLGVWVADHGTLELRDRQRYSFSSAPMRPDHTAIVVGHEGRWQFDDGQLVLKPDPPNLGPFALQRSEGWGVTTLSTDELVFRRRKGIGN